MPNLRKLHLFNAAPNTDEVPDWILHMPQLQELDFKGHITEAADLLTHLVLPLDVFFQLSFAVEDDTDLESIKSIVSHHFSRPDINYGNHPPYHHFYVFDEDENEQIGTMAFKASPFSTGWHDAPFSLSLSCIQDEDIDLIEFLEWIISQPPFNSVDYLILELTSMHHCPEDLNFMLHPTLAIRKTDSTTVSH
ncbi:hypothetical protein BC834DRAFT_968199 [Gloeopeniophorella convolvens]|nr:hypothetical protein BC834DRAFT_968199 [Gloeopeniophorella convolvens]